MSTSNDTQSSGEPQIPQSKSRRRSPATASAVSSRHFRVGSTRPSLTGRFLTGVMTGGLLGSLLAGGLSLYAHAQPGPGWWLHAGPGGHFRHAAYDPEMMSARIEFATDWLLSRIDASDGQRQQVKAIVQATVQDLGQVREQCLQNRQTLLQALAQPTIDRAALGDIRHVGLQLADTASDRIVTALADVAEVLTPEQRTKLAEFMSRWHH